MSITIIYTLIAVMAVSLMSLAGLVTLGWKEAFLKRILFYLVSLSAGALLGDVFLHLLPEMATEGFAVKDGVYFIAGILIFFLLERFILWHHSHDEHKERIHSVVYLSMLGDTLHNFLDGIVIAVSFLVSPALGIASTLAVIFHEIPQEIGQFAILLHGGWSKSKALWYNFISALSSILGAALVLIFAGRFQEEPRFLLAFAGASFIYIALSDLIPELHREEDTRRSIHQFMWFVLGIVLMGLLLFVE
jgi:zinc and cadmium transporter